MQRFRKKPVVIEAVQFVEANRNEWLALLEANRNEWLALLEAHLVEHLGNGLYAYIETLEGQMTVREGDWIIRGIVGELYPCKDDIFRQTYEAVD